VADQSDSSTKTEEATPRKLEEARKRGDVAKSIDVPSVASLAAAAGFLAIAGGWMARDLAAQLMPFVAHPDGLRLHRRRRRHRDARRPCWPWRRFLIGVMGAAALAGIGGNLIQHGFLFVPDKLKPDPSRLSPAEGFKRLFGIDGMVHFLKSAPEDRPGRSGGVAGAAPARERVPAAGRHGSERALAAGRRDAAGAVLGRGRAFGRRRARRLVLAAAAFPAAHAHDQGGDEGGLPPVPKAIPTSARACARSATSAPSGG